MLNFLKLLLTPEFFFSIIRISAPILFATLAAIVVEKAGFCLSLIHISEPTRH